MTSRTSAGSSTAYQYDALSRLRQVTASSGGITRYTYDALNHRVQRLEPGGTTNFLVDPFDPSGLSQVLRETDGSGTAIADYVYAGATPLSQDRGGSTSFYLKDGHGSTRLLTNPAGTVTDSFDYDAFGNILTEIGSTPNAYLYNGQQFDPSAGFYHLRARDYDATTGRFTAVDPFPGVGQDPVTLHPYLYAHNDPVNLSDPTGKFTLAETMFAANIVFTLASTALDVYRGNYKTAAVGVGLSIIPFGALFKFISPARRIVNLAPDAATEIVNLAPDAVTGIVNLVPEAVTETRLIAEQVAEAAALLPEVAAAAATGAKAVQLRVQQEAYHLFLTGDAALLKEFEGLRRFYVNGSLLASDMVPTLRRIIGTPNWQVKLCALKIAFSELRGGESFEFAAFATTVSVAVEFAMRGSGFQCKGRLPFPNLR